MKLPKERKERIQVLVLVVIGLAALVFAVVSLAINPLLARQRRNAKNADLIMENLAKADREVHGMVLLGNEYRRLQFEINAAESNDIVKPVLGSYLLSVRDGIEQTARRTDVKLTGIQEIGLQVLPIAAGAPNRTFRSYGIQVIGAAGYAQVRNFLAALEASNPYLSITEIVINGHADDPRVHGLSVRIEWPVMTGENIPNSAGEAK